VKRERERVALGGLLFIRLHRVGPTKGADVTLEPPTTAWNAIVVSWRQS
jgi:hypothetical protein